MRASKKKWRGGHALAAFLGMVASSATTVTVGAFAPPKAFLPVQQLKTVQPSSPTALFAKKKKPKTGGSGSNDAKKDTRLYYQEESAGGVIDVASIQTPAQEKLSQYVKDRGGHRVFRKVLIANNGMAATKSILSMRQWSYMEFGDERAIQFVAMATPEDIAANAEYVRLADSFVEVPGGKNLNNYANVDVICKVAKEQGVDAVWPGWGHASENPKLPASLDAMGITFIGPTSPVMSVLGDKIAANILAQTAKVPSIPWSGSYGGPNDGPLEAELTDEGTIPLETFEKGTVHSVEEALAAASKIGYENGIMIKASEGGGGKGIRLVYKEEDLPSAFQQVQNEVVGSPVFLMQLCQNARHIEVQIVGDEYGNAVALSGRDCSTQRRFQKIFEEAPPVIVPVDTFHEMEKAAQRLTSSIGYRGAGTVEFLYNADTNDYYFLELNPRLQVEHPVTEGVTLANLPATQLQVSMGIPLYSVPDVRRFYGKAGEDMFGTSPIDFLSEPYKPVDSHVIAARITAENPDEGFKPTAGTIEKIQFQSTPNVWGYFCVSANGGGIHEYADSQFGHLFAKGPTRDHARRALVLALKEIEVRGEIRTTVEYLVQLLETDEFKDNTITTSWLDGLIREKSVTAATDKFPDSEVVMGAAMLRAFEHVKRESEQVMQGFSAGQVVSAQLIPAIDSFNIEIPYKDTKYAFHVERTAPDVFRFTLGDNTLDAQVTETAEGKTLLATYGGVTHRIFGVDEPLGLRLVLDGVTILMPSIFDPSELRSDVTGKVVRYLHDNGGDVEAGQAYVEVEAMKMIMTLKAKESGKINQSVSPGAVISAGDLLGTLTLRDPSKVKKIKQFDGLLDVPDVPLETDTALDANHILAGFTGDPVDVGQSALAEEEDIGAICEKVTEAVTEFLRVENIFAGKILDDAVRDLIKAHGDDMAVAVSEIRAHQKLDQRANLILTMLRQVELLDGDQLSTELLDALKQVNELEGKVYGDLTLAADSIIRKAGVAPFDVRVDELRSRLLEEGLDLDKLSKSASAAGVDLLTYLFADPDKKVREKALEAYIRRVYRAHRLLDISTGEIDGRMTCWWSFQHKEVPSSESPVRHGLLSVVPNLDNLNKDVPKLLADFSSKFPDAKSVGRPINELYIASASSDGEVDVEKVEKALQEQERKLNMMSIRTANVLLPVNKKDPEYYTFTQRDGFKEDPLRRNMRPTFAYLLELGRLNENFDLERLPTLGKGVQVYIGTEKTEKPVRGGPPQVVFARGVSNTPGLTTLEGADRALRQGLDELERAQANSKVNLQSSSRIYLLSIPELEGTSPEEIAKTFDEVMEKLKSRLASRLLKLRVDEIEVKVRIATTDDDGKPMVIPVRLVASSMEGEWLKTTAYLDRPDPMSGVTREFCVLGDDKDEMCILDPYETSNIIQTKRSIARRVGSTYAYDFLGLLEVGLIGEWDAYQKKVSKNSFHHAMVTPSGIFQAQELLDGPNGELVLGSRQIGTNKEGMVAWLIKMKTPEYPDGREIVMIANDITVSSGSFAVEEDDIYFKASKYARDHKLPRIYIACNAGARIGLYDELKSKIRVKFYDDESPTKGFEYLYLSDDDYAALPEGAVIAHKVPEGWALDDIIGTKHGIGVENLQGSGMIAGETSKSYDDVFTLSYVTGRSVGIGAYLVRLGQRIIQMKQGPIILTGFAALNKLLGREVYTSNDQLGGPQIMVPNGVTHLEVTNDQEGVAAILEWLSYVPKVVGALSACRESSDPIEREVKWRPTPTPYDPRLMMTGTADLPGFFDDGSFKEYLAGWAKTVVVGRARLGGIPMGVVAVETRQVEQIVPADPADPKSREAVHPQAGQVLYPDSSYKTAQAIRDFDKEGLPVMIFANWRGFSGGSRDMAGEVLKYGSMIVDALREYSNPVFIYLPPNGELRGGSWVVLDPTINKDQMEMYADPDSRGGILEPTGITEIKFRAADQLKVMHKNDPQLQLLDSELEMADADSEAQAAIKAQIAAREDLLKPVYLQAAVHFADLHDKSGRMKAKGVIKDAVPWSKSREYFFYLAKRRMIQDGYVRQLVAADPSLDSAAALALLESMCPAGDWLDNKSALSFMTNNAKSIEEKIKSVKASAAQSMIDELKSEVGDS